MKPEDLIPVKTLTELMDAAKTKLRDLKFRITNFRSGGVFNTLLEIANQGLVDLHGLLRTIAPQFFLDTATGNWLEFRAADYETYKKSGQKTLGNVVFGRNAPGGNVVIAANNIVATKIDYKGERLKFYVKTPTVLQEGSLEVLVPCEAEIEGAEYNIGAGQITEILTNVSGVDYIRNDEDWITREGTDEEDDESLRARAKGKWKTLSAGPGADAYANWAASVPGVAVVQVDDQHPRGQGSVDVIITGTAGLPTQNLIDQVQAVIDDKKALCANVLVLGPEPVVVDWDVVLYVHPDHGDLDEIKAQGEEIIDIMFRYGDTENKEVIRVSTDYGVVRAQALANFVKIDNVINAVINQPAADVPVTARQLAVKGTVNVVAQKLS